MSATFFRAAHQPHPNYRTLIGLWKRDGRHGKPTFFCQSELRVGTLLVIPLNHFYSISVYNLIPYGSKCLCGVINKYILQILTAFMYVWKTITRECQRLCNLETRSKMWCVWTLAFTRFPCVRIQDISLD